MTELAEEPEVCGAVHPHKRGLVCTMPKDHGPIQVGSLTFTHVSIKGDEHVVWLEH